MKTTAWEVENQLAYAWCKLYDLDAPKSKGQEMTPPLPEDSCICFCHVLCNCKCSRKAQPPPERECKDGECCGKIQACICDCHKPPSTAGCCDICRLIVPHTSCWHCPCKGKCYMWNCGYQSNRHAHNVRKIEPTPAPSTDPSPRLSAVESRLRHLVDSVQVMSWDQMGITHYKFAGLITEPGGYEKALRELVALVRQEGKNV